MHLVEDEYVSIFKEKNYIKYELFNPLSIKSYIGLDV